MEQVLSKEELIAKAKFWGVGDNEYLSHFNIDEAIKDAIDQDEVLLLDGSETLKVEAFVPKDIDTSDMVSNVTECLIEHINENYGGPDEGYEVTSEMESCIKDFVDKFSKTFISWECREIGSVEINVLEWVKANEPEWLEQAESVSESGK